MRIAPIEIKSEQDAVRLMTSLGVSREGIKILLLKSLHSAFKIEGIKSWEANVIKQHLLSLGSDAAIERDALVKDKKTTALIFGNLSQLTKLGRKLRNQPFNLDEISRRLLSYLDNLQKKSFAFKARDKILNINKPVVCGIINVTADSFSGDGLLRRKGVNLKKPEDLAVDLCNNMVSSGAKMIDLGAESSRPFSKPITPSCEIKKVIPVLKALRREFKDIIISVDTYKYQVAKRCVDEGVDIINDITALRADTRIGSLIRKNNLGCILMHMKGKPSTMQKNPKYDDVVGDILDFFEKRLSFCFEQGINSNSVFIDPGIGFGKRAEDNIKIISDLGKLKVFGLPIFLGLSRKSFIGKILKAEVGERLIGSVSANVTAVIKGANVLRVHDVKETVEAISIASRILNN